jgi:Protein of unknown function (DUF3347)
MKRLLVALCLCTAAGAPALAKSSALKAIVGSYLKIQEQLAADKTDGVKAAAASIASSAELMGTSGAELVKAAKRVGDAADLKAAREAFGPLSDAVIALGQAEAWKDAGGVKVAFCPMVKRSWVQKDETLRNPYYGSAMLECGEFRK